MCDTQATSREHVPPLCFFPEKKDSNGGKYYRKNLITVPSCAKHNLTLSKDDQYLLFVICTHYQNNSVAQKHFSTKIIRSLIRRPALGIQQLSTSEQVIVNGKKTAAQKIDIDRLEKEIDKIARGIYFHESKKKLTRPLSIRAISLRLEENSLDSFLSNQLLNEMTQEEPKHWQNIPRHGENPEVFYCQIKESEQSNLFIRMVFYEGFIVVADTQVDDDSLLI